MTRAMVLVHTGFRREFGLMPQLVRGVFDGDRRHAGVIADHIEFIDMVLDAHHTAEDHLIWPRLLERCPEEIRPLVHGMESQHERIHALLDDLTKGIAAWRADTGGTNRESVSRTIDDLLPLLDEHLGMEEKYVLPLIEKHITAEEWGALAAEQGSHFPPEKRPLVLGMMMYEGAPSSIREMLASLPDEVRPIIAEAAPRDYGDYAEHVYGTPTPPYGSTLRKRLPE
jgi:hemerythrin-like domain-containing protein